MAEENVVSIAFADSSKAYQAFTEIKNLSTAGALQLKSGAIVVRDTEGKLSFPDGVDQVTGTGANEIMPYFLRVQSARKEDGSVLSQADLAAQAKLVFRLPWSTRLFTR